MKPVRDRLMSLRRRSYGDLRGQFPGDFLLEKLADSLPQTQINIKQVMSEQVFVYVDGPWTGTGTWRRHIKK